MSGMFMHCIQFFPNKKYFTAGFSAPQPPTYDGGPQGPDEGPRLCDGPLISPLFPQGSFGNNTNIFLQKIGTHLFFLSYYTINVLIN